MVLGAIDWGLVAEQTVSQALGIDAVWYALAAIGLNIHFGYAGLLNFGQIGFVAVGGYGLGISIVQWGLNPVLAIFVGILFAVVLALLLGLPALRLRADYLAIVTIAASEIIRIMARSTTLRGLTRGQEGLNEFNPAFVKTSPLDPQTFYGIGPLRLTGNQAWFALIGWIVVVIAVIVVWQIMRSPWGRVIKAIREDEDAARALGKNAYWYKVQALVLGGVLGGMAGMLQAIAKGTVQPDTFVPPITFFIWTALIIGGVGRILSPVAGAVILWGIFGFTDTLLRELVSEGLIPAWLMDANQVGQVRFILVGVMLALFMVFRPQGIFGSREEMMLDAR